MKIILRNDDYQDGRRLFIHDRPWTVLAPGRAPMYFRRYASALAVVVAIVNDTVATRYAPAA